MRATFFSQAWSLLGFRQRELFGVERKLRQIK